MVKTNTENSLLMDKACYQVSSQNIPIRERATCKQLSTFAYETFCRVIGPFECSQESLEIGKKKKISRHFRVDIQQTARWQCTRVEANNLCVGKFCTAISLQW